MLTDNQQFIHPLKALGIFATIVLAAASPETLLAAPNRCTTLIPLTAGETWRDPGSDAAENVCFDLDVEAPGIVALDLVTANLTVDPAAPRARLIFDGPRRLRQSPTSLVTAAPSGTYRVRVEGEDPRQPLPPFRLATRFSPVSKSETDGETELDPDPFASCGAKSETDGETELDPDPFAHDVSMVPEILRPHVGDLCQPGASDDHGDSFLCATVLSDGRMAAGEIANDQDDDVDVFRFQVKTLAPIAIDVRGEIELAVALYDRHGLRLATAGEGDRLRLVQTLVPGTYYVGLTGLDGSSGSYSIRLAP